MTRIWLLPAALAILAQPGWAQATTPDDRVGIIRRESELADLARRLDDARVPVRPDGSQLDPFPGTRLGDLPPGAEQSLEDADWYVARLRDGLLQSPEDRWRLADQHLRDLERDVREAEARARFERSR